MQAAGGLDAAKEHLLSTEVLPSVPWLARGKIPGKIMKFFTLTSWQVTVNCRGRSRVYLGLQTCQNDRVLCFHLDFSTRW